jgi:plastocyanin
MLSRFLALAALIALAVFAAACGGDDDDDVVTGDDDDSAPATSAPAADGTEADVTITVAGSAFDPSDFSVPADADVVIAITNEDSVAHNFTVYKDDAFTEMQGTTLPLPAGGAGNVFGTFAAGEYYFRCEIHPEQMQGSFTAE